MTRLAALFVCVCSWAVAAGAAAGPVDYVKDVKPLLKARCYACHSGLRQRSGLRLDTPALIRQGGDSGEAIEPGKADDSLLVQMLTGELGTRMPPEDAGAALTAEQIDVIKAWINQGAKAPDEAPPPDPHDHWAFKPPERPPLPALKNQAWVRNPIDALVGAAHEAHGLTPVEPAERAVLLRRVYLDLIGLPPTREELLSFLADESPSAYERVVDRLLESPQYGERWGRHWMDVWRYSDWSGYKQEIRNSARHIWRWRDWIVESLNADKGYDRMVLEMLAGDEIGPTDPDTLRATGFLARNWYKFNRNTWLDNTVEHTSKALLGMTINCARCHDHKYDPISQLDYYQMRAIFEPHDLRTDRVPGEPDPAKDGLPRIQDLRMDEPTYLFVRGNDKHPDKEHPLSPSVPAALGGALQITPVELPLLAYYPALEEFALKEDLAKAARDVDERRAALDKAPGEVEAARAKLDELTTASATAGDDEKKKKEADAALAAAREALAKAESAAELSAPRLATAQAAQAALAARIDAEKAKYGLAPGTDAAVCAQAAVAAERALALCQAKEGQIAAQQGLAQAKAVAKQAGDQDEKTRKAAEAAEKKLESAVKQVETAQAAADKPTGNFQPLGKPYPKTSTGRRLAFARWVVDRRNPLAARVAINHIWLRHFGAPLVDNMFDFGLRSPTARNQPLLDWLAVELMEGNWRMKPIHKLIVTSNTYRMRSSGAGAAAANAKADPDNRFLWRMNTRRLEAEAVRDALLHVAGDLDLRQGGADIDQHAGQTTPRRSIYFRHAYEKQMKFLELFDAASVNECYRRSESIVPQQALALANSQLSIDQARVLARRLAERAAQEADPEASFVTLAFQQILTRDPTPEELTQCRGFLTEQAALLADPAKLTQFTGGAKPAVAPAGDAPLRAKENLVHVLLNHNDFVTIR